MILNSEYWKCKEQLYLEKVNSAAIFINDRENISWRGRIMNQSKESILVIDDDKELCDLLAEYLKPEGFTIQAAHDGETGMEMALANGYSIILLDVMLPGGHNGFAVLQNIRAKITTPVLMLTARGEDVDRIVGLEMGADDYLPKPFNPRELLARIHAILRRVRAIGQVQTSDSITGKYKVDDIELNINARIVSCAGTRVDFTSVEFSILEVLMRNVGKIVTRDTLANDVLGRSLSPYDRSIDVHVSRLRKKLGCNSDSPERIKAIRGAGYIYVGSSLSNDGKKNNS
jgi:two-component system response regulator CpxR